MGKRKHKKRASGRPASPTANVVRIPTYSPPIVPAWQAIPIEEAEAYARKRMVALGITPPPVKLEDLPDDVKAQVEAQIAEGKTEIVVVLPSAYGDVAAMAREIMDGGNLAPIRVEALRHCRKTDAVAAALAVMPAPTCDSEPVPKPRRRFPIPR